MHLYSSEVSNFQDVISTSVNKKSYKIHSDSIDPAIVAR